MATAKEKKAAATALAIAIRELPAIVAATLAGSFVYTSKLVHMPLIAAGFVEINETDVALDAEGNSATKATEAGIAEAAKIAAGGAAPVPASAPAKPVIALEDNVAIPAAPVKGGGVGRESIYPFKEMQVNQSFFIPATAEKPEPWKSLASTVSNAEKAASVVKTIQAVDTATGALLFEADGTTPKLQTVMKTVKCREKGKEGQMKQVPELVKVKTFIVREDVKDGVKGARVWRTA